MAVLQYRTGEIILAGDVVDYHGDPGHFALLDWLARDDQIDWSRAVVDSCSIRAVCGGDETGPNPTDRAKRGSKLYEKQKRWEEFDRLSSDTLARQRRVLGDNHQDTLDSLANLQVSYFARGRYEEALPGYRRSPRIRASYFWRRSSLRAHGPPQPCHHLRRVGPLAVRQSRCI